MTTSTERVHRHRERRRRGVVVVVPTEVSGKVLRKLVREGWLTYDGGNTEVTPSMVSAALSEMLETWAHE